MTATEEILFKMGIDATKMEHAMRDIKSKVGEWAREQIKTLAAVGAGFASIEGIKRAYDATVEFAEKTIDLSRRLGMSTDAIQVWDYALRKNGGTIEDAAGFFEHLAEARDNALAGGDEGKKLTDSFKQLGVSIDDLKSKRIEDIAAKMSDVFKSGDPQKLIGALREVAGRGAGEVIATLRDGIAEAREEAEKLGLVVQHSALLKLKEAGDQSVILGNRLKAAFAPWIAEMMDGLDFLVTSLQALWARISATTTSLANHPTQFKEAFQAGDAASQKVIDEMMERDKAFRRKENRDEAGSGGSDIVDKHEAEHKKAQDLDKESARLEEQAKEKSLSLAERVAYLNLRRNRLQEELNDKTKTELENAQTRNELAKINLQYQDALNEKRQREKELAQETLDKNRQLRDMKRSREESLMEPAQWTVEELAKHPIWTPGINQFGVRGMVQDIFSQEAQQIEFLQRRAHTELHYGNLSGARADMKRAESLRMDLDAAGITKRDSFARMDYNINEFVTAMKQKGIPVQVADD